MHGYIEVTKKDWDNLHSLLRKSDIVLGDLNINTRDAQYSGLKMLNKILKKVNKVAVLDEPTHQTFGQPDHILLHENFPLPC